MFRNFYLKIFIFLVGKFSVYLNRRVFVMINPQWLELPMSRTNFHDHKNVRANEIRLHFNITISKLNMAKQTAYSFVLRPTNKITINMSKITNTDIKIGN